MADRNAIVLVADANWFAAGAFVADQLASLRPPTGTDIILFSDSADDLDKARAFGLRAQLMPLDSSLLDPSFPIHDHFTRATYGRIFLPRMLAGRYRRLVYLDVDVYVHSGKIFDLFGLDLHGHAVAAVLDPWIALLDPEAGERTRTIANAENRYFNAGVLVIEPSAYLAEDLERRLLSTIAATPERLRYSDQSALNIVLDGNWLELSPAFNTSSVHWGSFVRAVSEPVITHFAGSMKPWHGPRFNIDHPARQDLERFLRASPWAGFLAQFYSFKDAWNVLSGKAALPPPVATPKFRMTPHEENLIANYLRTTDFADVEQGITDLRLDRIPASLRPPAGSASPAITPDGDEIS